MANHVESSTNPSLISRIKKSPADETAWQEFVDRYGAKIYGWASQWTKQQSDTEEVTQEVLTKLFLNIQKFQYDPEMSFRGWLRRVTRNVWNDLFGKQNRAGIAMGNSGVRLKIESFSNAEDLSNHLEEIFDLELLEKAMENAKLRLNDVTWQSFYLTRISNQPVTEVAALLKIPLGTLYTYRSRAQHILKEEVAKLDRTENDND